ncbi:MAG: ABC transporter substrate-binding protein [bacterium]|nr:ABC transporter substrate-binding protein [bacterium]
MKRRLVSMVMAGAMILSLAGCGGSGSGTTTTAATTAAQTEATTAAETTKAEETTTAAEKAEATDGKTYQIGVLQLVQHSALDRANEGFIKALDDSGISYEADQQNAAGEQSTCTTIAEQFVNDKKDLILAIATPAAQAAAAATTEIPIILTAVTDPADSGLVESNEKPGGNVTGTSDLTPVKEQIELLTRVFPEAKKVGILYCSAESNSVLQATMAQEACDAVGLEHQDYTVSSSNEIQTVVESMVGNVDVIYAPTDNMVAAGMATVAMVATENKLPVICGEAGMVEAGGLATYGVDYYQLGYVAGQQAVDILTGKATPAETPIGYMPSDKCELKVNEDTAAALGLDPATIK